MLPVTLFEHGIETAAGGAVVQAGRRPPAGLGLDDGVPVVTPATMEEEPRQGLLTASGLSFGSAEEW